MSVELSIEAGIATVTLNRPERMNALTWEMREQLHAHFRRIRFDDDVRALLGRINGSGWTQAPAVGEGEEFRCTAGADTHASALLFSGSVVHGSAVVVA